MNGLWAAFGSHTYSRAPFALAFILVPLPFALMMPVGSLFLADNTALWSAFFHVWWFAALAAMTLIQAKRFRDLGWKGRTAIGTLAAPTLLSNYAESQGIEILTVLTAVWVVGWRIFLLVKPGRKSSNAAEGAAADIAPAALAT